MKFDYEYNFNDMPQFSSFFSNTIIGTIMYIIAIILFFGSILYIFKAAYSWYLFKKMGRKGWEGVIPIYNTIIKLEVLNIPLWMILLAFIPGANIVLSVIIAINIAKKFSKDTIFTIGLIFLPIIFYPILAFGKDTFNKDMSGIFEEAPSTQYRYGYCPNCGEKLTGKYCSKCGTKSDS